MIPQMRILLVTHFFPPKHNSGTENYTLGLAQSFVARGHQVQVVCAEDWQTGNAYWNGVTEDNYGGVQVFRLHLNWTKAGNPNQVLYESLPVERWFDQFLCANRPDIVHVTSAYTLGVGVLRSVHRLNIPLVLTLMDFWFLCPRSVLVRGDNTLCEGQTTPWECQKCLLMSSKFNQRIQPAIPAPLHRAFWKAISGVPALRRLRGARGMLLDMTRRKMEMKLTLQAPEAILSHSRLVQGLIAKAGLSERVVHLRNGIDISWAKEYQGKSSSQGVRFGYLGQITEIKGVHLLVQAFQRAVLKGNERLDIWGDLNREIHYANRLKDLIASSKSVNLRGRFDRSQLAGILAEIDVLVVPSIWHENAPLVIQEAFASKTPVIATDLGGMSEAVSNEVNGLLFERGNVNDLARQLQRIVTEPNLLDRLRRGISPVKTIGEETDELQELYRNLITAKKQMPDASPTLVGEHVVNLLAEEERLVPSALSMEKV